MEKSKFILNNYVKPKLIGLKNSNCNASYIYLNDKKYILSRRTNYAFGIKTNDPYDGYVQNDGYSTIWSDELIYNENLSIEKFLTTCSESEKHSKWCGYEDGRVIKWNNEYKILFTKRDNKINSHFNMHYCSLDNNLNIINDEIIKTPVAVEKNWQPIEILPDLCVYSYQPFRLINLKTKTYLVKNNKVDVHLCGSTQIIKYNDDFNLGLCHIRNEHFEYIHYFVLFDKNMNLINVSEPFSFFGCNVEYTTYLENKNGNIVILISLHDQILYEFILTIEILSDIFDRKLDNNIKDNEIYTKLYNDSLSVDNIFAALVFASYSLNKTILVDAIDRNHKQNYFRDVLQQTQLQRVLLNNYGK